MTAIVTSTYRYKRWPRKRKRLHCHHRQRQHISMSANEEVRIETAFGSWQLVGVQTIIETGEIIDLTPRGNPPFGILMYANDCRMLVLNLSSGRPKLDSLESITDEQRVQLLRTMAAYRGTYPSKPAVIVVKRGRRPGLLEAAAEVSHRREPEGGDPAMAGQLTRPEKAD